MSNSMFQKYLQNVKRLSDCNNCVARTKCEQTVVEIEEDLQKDSNEFTQILTQLRPLVVVLQILGTYPIVGSTTKWREIQNRKIHRERLFSFPGGGGNSSHSRRADMRTIKTDKITFPEVDLASGNDDDLYDTLIVGCRASMVLWWYTYSVKLVFMFSVISWICNLGLGIPFPMKLYSFQDNFGVRVFGSIIAVKINKSTIVITGAVKILEMIFLWLNLKHFVVWLNNWSIFERAFHICFSSRSADGKSNFDFDIRESRNCVLFFYFGCLGLVWIFVVMFALTPVYQFHVPFFSWACLLMVTVCLWCTTLLEDVKLFIIIKTMGAALREIRIGIKDTSEFRLITASDVTAWLKLLQLMRTQVSFACRHLKSQQLLLTIEAVFSGSLGITVILSVLGKSYNDESSKLGFLLATGWFCMTQFGRLYIKVVVAESLHFEEVLMADEILKTDTDNLCDKAAKPELKFVYNLITTNPIGINLGNYVTLDKKLLLTVSMQVAAYLIVFMQFTGSLN